MFVFVSTNAAGCRILSCGTPPDCHKDRRQARLLHFKFASLIQHYYSSFKNKSSMLCFMDFLTQSESLSLEHMALLSPLWTPLCQSQDLQFAEYSFANNFIFRKQHAYRFLPTTPPFVLGEFKTGGFYLIPTVPLKDLPDLSDPVCFFPIPESWLSEFSFRHPQISSSREDMDYLFKREKLETLAGRALSSRRNLLHQFQREFFVESKSLNSENVAEAFKVLETWQVNLSSHSDLSKEQTDYFSAYEALQYREQLHLFGRVAYADGVAVGFTLGELLTQKTALLHTAKAILSYKGVTPYLYQDFAQHLPESVLWINLEQDLGIPALRQAKNAYVPDLLLPKWRIQIG